MFIGEQGRKKYSYSWGINEWVSFQSLNPFPAKHKWCRESRNSVSELIGMEPDEHSIQAMAQVHMELCDAGHRGGENIHGDPGEL